METTGRGTYKNKQKTDLRVTEETENDPPTQESTEEIKRRTERNLQAAERKVSQYRK